MNATKKFRDPVSKHINKNRTHYLKWCLTDDISVRYHMLHQGNRSLEGQFILKIHSKSSFQLMERDFAKQLIHAFRKEEQQMICVNPNMPNDMELVKPDYEVIGALRPDKKGKLQYHKTIINLTTYNVESGFEVDIDQVEDDLNYITEIKEEFKEKVSEDFKENLYGEILKNPIFKTTDKEKTLTEEAVVVKDKVYFNDGQHVHRLPDEDKMLEIQDYLIIYIKDENNYNNNAIIHLSINDNENKAYFPSIKRCDMDNAKLNFLNMLKGSVYGHLFNYHKFEEIKFLCNIDDPKGYLGNNDANVYVVEYKTDNNDRIYNLIGKQCITTLELESMKNLYKKPTFYIDKLNVKKICDKLTELFITDIRSHNDNVRVNDINIQETIRDMAVEHHLVDNKFLNVTVDDTISNNTVKCELILNREMFDSEKIVYLYVSEFIGQNATKIVAIEDEGKYRLPTLMIPIKQDTSLFNTVPYSVVDLNETYPAEFLCSKADKADKKLLVTYYIRYLPSDEWDLDLYSQNIEKSKFLDIYLFNNILETSNDLKNVQNEVANYIAGYKSNVNQYINK